VTPQLAALAIDQKRRADLHHDQPGVCEQAAHGVHFSLAGLVALTFAGLGLDWALGARRFLISLTSARSTSSTPWPDTPESRCTGWPQAFSSAAFFLVNAALGSASILFSATISGLSIRP